MHSLYEIRFLKHALSVEWKAATNAMEKFLFVLDEFFVVG